VGACIRSLSTPVVQAFIIALILLNAVVLGLETSPAATTAAGRLILALDQAIIAAFVLESGVRIHVYRRAFWRDPWSPFDFAVVAIALVAGTGQLAVLRAWRVLRLLAVVPSMRRVVGELLASIPGLGSIGLVLMIYCVFAVIATHLFATAYPECFGHLGRSLYTLLFQIVNPESWSMGISRPVMESFPYAWAFFIPFILVATFTMLKLFIAIIVNAMQRYNEQERQDTVATLEQPRDHIEADVHAEVLALREEIRELETLLLVRGETEKAVATQQPAR
jgi:voltage-gated sodium channel